MKILTRTHVLAALFLILLGVIHIAMTPVFFGEFTMRVMWYVAQGLMGMVIGFLNIATIRSKWQDHTVAVLCHIANGLGLVFACSYALVDPSIPSYVGILLLALLFVSALAIGRETHAARHEYTHSG